jgi:hypothetical protein
MLAYGSDSPRSSGDGPVAAAFAPLAPHQLVPPHLLPHHAFGAPPPAPAPTPPLPPFEPVALSLAAGNVVKLKGLPFKATTEQDVARFFAAFRFASAAPVWSIFLRRHPDGRLTGEVSLVVPTTPSIDGELSRRPHFPSPARAYPPNRPNSFGRIGAE